MTGLRPEWLEYDPTGFPLYEPLFVSPPTVTDGDVSLPTEPGLGVAIDESVIGPYRTE